MANSSTLEAAVVGTSCRGCSHFKDLFQDRFFGNVLDAFHIHFCVQFYYCIYMFIKAKAKQKVRCYSAFCLARTFPATMTATFVEGGGIKQGATDQSLVTILAWHKFRSTFDFHSTCTVLLSYCT